MTHLLFILTLLAAHPAQHLLDAKTATTIAVFHRAGLANNFVLSPSEARPIGVAIVEASLVTGVPREVLMSVIEQESGYLARRNREGAAGLMQLKSPTAEAYCPRATCDLEDPADNVAAGASYLAFLKFRFGSWPAALTAYNAGPGAFIRSGRKISAYARAVVGRLPKLRAALARAARV